MSLDDVKRIRAILIDHCEWIDVDYRRAFVDEEGVFVWPTVSCGGEAIAALVNVGYDVYTYASSSYSGLIEFRIS